MFNHTIRIGAVLSVQPAPALQVSLDDSPADILSLDPAADAAANDGMRFDLAQSQRLGYPICLDADGGIIRAIHLPEIGRVGRLDVREDGSAVVTLSSNPAPFIVPPDPGELLALLQDAQTNRYGVVVVTGEDGSRIRFVRPAAGSALNWIDRGSTKTAWVTDEALFSVPFGRAEELFAGLAGKTCNPKDSAQQLGSSDCIPFNKPDGGCEARAQAMWQWLHEQKVHASKIWMIAERGRFLLLKTKNSESCEIAAEWHVAVSLQVKKDGAVAEYVIDPATDERLLKYEEWFDRWHGGLAKAALHRSREDTYTLDDDYEPVRAKQFQPQNDLSTWRWKLARSRRPPFDCK